MPITQVGSIPAYLVCKGSDGRWHQLAKVSIPTGIDTDTIGDSPDDDTRTRIHVGIPEHVDIRYRDHESWVLDATE